MRLFARSWTSKWPAFIRRLILPRLGWAVGPFGVSFLCRSATFGFISVVSSICGNNGHAIADVTYSDLTRAGRPADFYVYDKDLSDRSRETCIKVLAELNKPLPRSSYDLKEILLGTAFGVTWRNEVVTKEKRWLIGRIKTATIPFSQLQAMQRTTDAKEGPIDSLYLLPNSTISAMRVGDGRLDSVALSHLLSQTSGAEKIVPKSKWIQVHQSYTDGNSGTPFSSDYYWSDLLTMDGQSYVFLASPPQFDSDEQLAGVISVFMASIAERAVGDLVCHFVHKA